MSNVHKDFYVYEYYIVNTDEVFYIGKGRQNRYRELHNRNKYFNNIMAKYTCDVRIVESGLTNKEACLKEKEFIKKRWSKGQARCNLTAGGTGFSEGKLNPRALKPHKGELNYFYGKRMVGEENHFYGKKHTEETKRKISMNRKGKGGQPGKLNPMYGKGRKGEDNPMYGKTRFDHHNAVKFHVVYPDGDSEYLTAKECEKKFGIAFTRIRKTGGTLHYKKNTPNKTLYENTVITII